MPKLLISTKKSLYKPIVVNIDGQDQEVIPITKKILKKLKEFEDKIREGDAEAAYAQLELLMDTKKFTDKLELRQVNEIIRFVTISIHAPEKKETKPEKKESGSGETA